MTGTDLILPEAAAGRLDALGRHLPLDTADQVYAFTRALVGAAFLAENITRQADRDRTTLTASGAAGCTRQAAYRRAHTLAAARAAVGLPVVDRYEPSDPEIPEEAREALLGTWIHDHLIPWMVAAARALGLDAVGEDPVQVTAGGIVIPGRLDFAIPGVVWDIKSVKEWRLHGVRRRGVFTEHEVQVGVYGLGRFQAGYPVRWVVWIYIDRSTGEVHVESREFTNAYALEVIDRLRTIGVHADSPDLAPRDGRGPGLSLACDRCPWLTRCWGPDATSGQRGAQKILAATPEGVAKALALYSAGAAAESRGASDKDFAKLILADTPNGIYGDWVLDRKKAGRTRDQAKITEDYAARGEPVPTVETTPALKITRKAQDDTR